MPETSGNYAGKKLFTFTPGGPTDSGPLLFREVSSFKEMLFQLTGPGTGWQVTVYGTVDRDTAASIPLQLGPPNYPNTSVASASGVPEEWFLLPAPTSESGSAWSNPMMTDSPGASRSFFTTGIPIAIRLVAAPLTAGVAPVGSISVLANVRK